MSLTLPDSFKIVNDVIENWVILLGYNKGVVSSGVNTAEVLNTTETDIDVVDGSKFSEGDFIVISTERMKVTSVSSNTLTVVRGINKTPSSDINSGTLIMHDNFKPISFADTKFEGEYSNGIITSEPSIRESINLESSTSKTSNVSLSVANFNYKGNPFSKELFAGTRTYINRECFIYLVPTTKTLKVDSLLMFNGRLQSVSHDNDSIKLSIVSKNPWDGVEIPQTKTSKGNYFPVAYGDYTPNSAGLASFGAGVDIDDYRKRKSLYPIPVEERRRDTLFALTGTRSTSANGFPHYYEKSTDTFLPLSNDATNYGTVDVENETYGDGYAIRFHQNLLKRGLYKVVEFVSKTAGDNLTWDNNTGNAFDGEYINTSTYVGCTVDDTFVPNDSASIEYSLPQLTGYPSLILTNLVITGSFTLSGNSNSGVLQLQLIDNSFGASDVKGYWDLNNNGTTTTFHKTAGGNLDTSSVAYLSDAFDNSNEYLASGNGWGETIKFTVKLVRTAGAIAGNVSGFVRIHDIAIETATQLDFAETTKAGKTVAYQTLDNIKDVYTGANGLTDNGWAGSSAITEIHEAHRDLLQRFTNFTNSNNSDYSTSINPKNWSSGTNINSIKDWDIRYWINKPVLLNKVLEELQYNGGFIGRYNGQGNYQYVFIPDSITTNFNLTKADINKIDISLTPFDKVVTSMDIEYEKHPATSGYVSEVSSSNSTSISAYNVKSKENKKRVRLNALVSAPATSPSSNPNDDFYTYYDNILGGVKHLVSFNIVNPIYFGVDVGDFIAFNNLGVEPFGGSWSGKNFIIVSVNRKRGSLKIKAREI